MLRFNAGDLGKSLDRLSSEYRTAFAAACAQRLLPRYSAFYARLHGGRLGEEQLAETFLDLLWRDLSASQLDDGKIETMINRLLATLPDEETTLAANEPYCTDAGATVIFALQARLTSQTKFAVLAARRIYHALDNFVMNNVLADKPRISERDEEAVLAHPLIQRELARQQDDLEMLGSASLPGYDKATVLSNLRRRAEEQGEEVFIL